MKKFKSVIFFILVLSTVLYAQDVLFIEESGNVGLIETNPNSPLLVSSRIETVESYSFSEEKVELVISWRNYGSSCAVLGCDPDTCSMNNGVKKIIITPPDGLKLSINEIEGTIVDVSEKYVFPE